MKWSRKRRTKDKEQSVYYCVCCQHEKRLICPQTDGIMAIPKWMNLFTPYWKPLNVPVWLESLVSSPGAGQSCGLDWTEPFFFFFPRLSGPLGVQRTSQWKLWTWKCLLMRLKGPKVHPIPLWSEDGNSPWHFLRTQFINVKAKEMGGGVEG